MVTADATPYARTPHTSIAAPGFQALCKKLVHFKRICGEKAAGGCQANDTREPLC